MVAGAIVVAVSIELRLTHDHADAPLILATVGGPLLFLAGNTLFLRSRAGPLARSRYLAMAALLAVCALALPLGSALPPLLLGAVVLAVMTALAAYTHRASGGRAP